MRLVPHKVNLSGVATWDTDTALSARIRPTEDSELFTIDKIDPEKSRERERERPVVDWKEEIERADDAGEFGWI